MYSIEKCRYILYVIEIVRNVENAETDGRGENANNTHHNNTHFSKISFHLLNINDDDHYNDDSYSNIDINGEKDTCWKLRMICLTSKS